MTQIKLKEKPNEEICIYVIGHKKFKLPTEDSIYIPMMVGDKISELPKGFISDSTGVNISYKNLLYNELTGLYWIWKNSNADIVGICHYRRYFTTLQGKMQNLITKNIPQLIDETYIYKALECNDLIIHNKTFFLKGNKEQLCINPKVSDEGNKNKLDNTILKLAEDVFTRVYPEDICIYQKIMKKHSAHLLNVVIGRKETIDKYCEWLFIVLNEIEKEIDRSYPNEILPRVIGLLAERMLDVWIVKEKLKIKECFTINTEKIDWKAWG